MPATRPAAAPLRPGGNAAAPGFVLRASGQPVELLHVAERGGGPAPEALVELPCGRRLTVALAELGAAPLRAGEAASAERASRYRGWW